ncbi:MAG: hypothetical protein AB7P52_17765 [Alphaproteobacteria bacterium]
MALTADRNTPERVGALDDFPLAAATKVYAGGLACLDAAGNAVPGATATTLIGIGRFEEQVDNSAGLAGDKTVKVRRGVFRWKNSSDADAITKAEIGDICYVVDDETVAKTDGSASRSRAGIVDGVDSLGVWVRMGVTSLNTPASALLAANNLSDVGTKATARSNLGVYEKFGTPTIVVGSEAGEAINVTIQLKDSAGTDLAVRGSVYAYLSDDANGDSIAGTAPDTVAIGTDGLAIELVAKKAWVLVSEADGDIDITIGEDGEDTWYLILVMPDGRLVASEAITFAA